MRAQVAGSPRFHGWGANRDAVIGELDVVVACLADERAARTDDPWEAG
jgi:hypothetical protein